jgi:hypothetical protein
MKRLIWTGIAWVQIKKLKRELRKIAEHDLSQEWEDQLIVHTALQLAHERIDSMRRQLGLLSERIDRIELRLIEVNWICCIDGPKPKFPLLDKPHAHPLDRVAIVQDWLDCLYDHIARIERRFL